MKKTICILLVLSLCLSMVACGSKTTVNTTQPTTQAPTETTAPETEAPTTEAPTTEPETEPEEVVEELPEPEDLVVTALSNALQDDRFTYYSDTLYLSYIAGYLAEVRYTFNSYGHGESFIGQLKQNIYENVEGEYSEIEIVENLFDGTYTYDRDDTDEHESEEMTDGSEFEEAIREVLDDVSIKWDYVEETSLIDLGARYFVDFTYAQEYKSKLEAIVCDAIGVNQKMVDNFTEKQDMTTAGGYMLVDKETGSLLAFNENITFEYLYDGETYPQIYDFYISVTPDDYSAYKEITGVDGPVEEPENKATPVFYHVTGENGQELWLLGTIHVGDERTSYLPDEVYAAFDAADALAVEVDTEKMEQLMDEDEEFAAEMQSYYYYADGSSITDHLDPEIYEEAVMAMKRSGDYRYYYDDFCAAVWSSIMDNDVMSLSKLRYDYGVDERLLSRAYAQEKEVISLEKYEDHLAIGIGCSDRLQQLLLIGSCEQDVEAYIESCEEMFEIWCEGSEERIIAYFNEEEEEDEILEEDEELPAGYTDEEIDALNEEYDEYMIGSRNPDMIKNAIDFLESGRVIFYCVGLAHVLGDENLVDGLRDAGYTVELVEYAQ